MNECDHDGDGDGDGDGNISLGEYSRDFEAWFNPFEAPPGLRSNTSGRTQDVLVETKIDLRTHEIRKPSPRQQIEVRLRADAAVRSILLRTDTEGNAELNMAPYLWRLEPRALDIDVLIADPEVDILSGTITAAIVKAVLRSRRDVLPANAVDEDGNPI